MSEPVFEYGPDDIVDQEVDFQILPEARSAVLTCPQCGAEMVPATARRSLAGGQFTVTYPVYECPRCGRRYLNPQQAQRFGSLLLLEQWMVEQGHDWAGNVLFDGQDFFVRLPLVRALARLQRPALKPAASA